MGTGYYRFGTSAKARASTERNFRQYRRDSSIFTYFQQFYNTLNLKIADNFFQIFILELLFEVDFDTFGFHILEKDFG